MTRHGRGGSGGAAHPGRGGPGRRARRGQDRARAAVVVEAHHHLAADDRQAINGLVEAHDRARRRPHAGQRRSACPRHRRRAPGRRRSGRGHDVPRRPARRTRSRSGCRWCRRARVPTKVTRPEPSPCTRSGLSASPRSRARARDAPGSALPELGRSGPPRSRSAQRRSSHPRARRWTGRRTGQPTGRLRPRWLVSRISPRCATTVSGRRAIAWRNTRFVHGRLSATAAAARTVRTAPGRFRRPRLA